jgi:hypothetical protein
MSAKRKRSSGQPRGGFSYPDSEATERLVRAPELDTCNYYSKSIGLAFDPQRVLLRRVFFLTRDKSKYVSVGFYPSSNYQPLVQFGGSHNKPIIITSETMETIASHLPDSAINNSNSSIKRARGLKI